MEKEIRELILDTQVKMLEAQLRAVKRLSGKDKKKEVKERGMSQVEYVYNILKKARKDLHINEIIDIARSSYRIQFDRETLASALSKKVLKGDRFIRPGKNTFGLKEGY